MEWTVNVAAASTYTLRFRYANGGGGDRPLELKVNGSVVNSSLYFITTGAWTTFSYVTNSASLNSGNNTIRLTAIGSSGADIDYVSLD